MINKDDTMFDLYDLLCHKAAFCNNVNALRRRHIERTHLIESSADPALREAYHRELSALTESWKSWHHQLQLPAQENLYIAVQIIYDPAAKEITTKEAEPKSIDPGEYPDHLTRTSELLTFTYQLSSARLFFGGDIKWWSTKEYRLQKLLAYLLDTEGPFDYERIRVNTEDDEDWDFVYPKYDDDVLQYASS